MWIMAIKIALSILPVFMERPPATFESRAKDWRMGAVIYQVFPDRFAPSANLPSKQELYTSPRKLRTWTETPHSSRYDPLVGYPHVFEFWGGDLQSIQSKLDYLSTLHADVLYLNPIFKAASNHKYDTEDYTVIAPEFGMHADLKSLIQSVHKRGMKIMLDGVFNHMGFSAPAFQSAKKSSKSPFREWFTFGKRYKGGYKSWFGSGEMPVLNLENSGVQRFLWRDKESIVRRYLRAGIDGWRLDVAYDMGPLILQKITGAAHDEKAGSAVVGEISGYPAQWFSSVDGVFNFYSMQLVIEMLKGRISGGVVGRTLANTVSDAGIENVLRSWLLIDNHDTPRAKNLIPDPEQARVAMALLFSLPGSPVIYYGTELGMEGEGDPENRAPMRWDLVNENNPHLKWVRQLAKLRKYHPALRYGDFHALETEQLLAFVRMTHRLRETVLVVVNPTSKPVTETFGTRIGRMMSWGTLKDLLGGTKVLTKTGLITLEVPPLSVMLLAPETAPNEGYSPYDRIP